MNWEDEPWVKLYTRKTAADLRLSESARLLWFEILCSVDKSGVIPLSGNAAEDLSLTCRVSLTTVERGLPELLHDGRICLADGALVIPNFVEAQRARKSQRQSQQDYRDRRRADAMGGKLSKSKKKERESHSETEPVCKNRYPNDVPLFSSLSSSHLSSDLRPDGAADNKSPEWHSPPPVAFPGEGEQPLPKQRLLSEFRAEVLKLWELQEKLRAEAFRAVGKDPGASKRPTAELLVPIAERLAAGASVQDCEHVLRVYAKDVKKDKASAQWFNRTTNWKPERFNFALGQELPKNGQGGGLSNEEFIRRHEQHLRNLAGLQ